MMLLLHVCNWGKWAYTHKKNKAFWCVLVYVLIRFLLKIFPKTTIFI